MIGWLVRWKNSLGAPPEPDWHNIYALRDEAFQNAKFAIDGLRGIVNVYKQVGYQPIAVKMTTAGAKIAEEAGIEFKPWDGKSPRLFIKFQWWKDAPELEHNFGDLLAFYWPVPEVKKL